MRYQGIILAGLMIISTTALADLTNTEQNTVDTLNCRATGYQFLSSQRLLLGDGYGAKQQLFLIKNIAHRPVLIDYPQGHIGASAGIGRDLARGGWTTYYYTPGATMPAQDSDGDTVQRKPRWTCALQMKDGSSQTVDCRKALYVCEIDAADSGNLNPDVQAILKQGKTGWLTMGKTTADPDSQSSISKALKASIVTTAAPAAPGNTQAVSSPAASSS